MLRSISIALVACAVAVLAPAAATAAPKSKPNLLVSVGDSYASGFQRFGEDEARNTREGFAYQLPRLARSRGYDLRLVNFGCGGADTESILRTRGCAEGARGPGGRVYEDVTQATAAARFLKANRGRVAVVTVSIGGNDVTECAREADPVPCVVEAVKTIDRNLAELLRKLRRAAGPKVRFVGITYPNVILGDWLKGDPGKSFAALSQVAFKDFINPTLRKRYTAVGGRFADVTEATDGNDPLDAPLVARPDLSPEPVPAPVARVCDLTSYCQFGDIHPRTEGYTLIARLVAEQLPRRRR